MDEAMLFEIPAPPTATTTPKASKVSIKRFGQEDATTVGGGATWLPQFAYQTSGVGEWLALIYNVAKRETAETQRFGRAKDTPSPDTARDTGPAIPIECSEVVCPASSQPDVVQVHMAIPLRFTAAILGNLGVHMKQIAATVGCKVRMASHNGFDNQLIIVVGNYNQCVIVQEVVHARMVDALRADKQEPNDQLEVVLFVRAEAAGVVIGKQGFVLNQIRKQSGVKIQLLREQVMGQRPCILTGMFPSILRAERHIFHLVRAVPVATPTDLPLSPPPLSPPLHWGSPFLATPLPSTSP